MFEPRGHDLMKTRYSPSGTAVCDLRLAVKHLERSIEELSAAIPLDSQLAGLRTDFEQSQEQLKNLRLTAAAVLLHDPGIRVKEIQARVGIADASHFCRDFRDRFGVSPSEYRFQITQRSDSVDTPR